MSATANDSSRGASAASAGKPTSATGGSASRSATSTQSCVHCGATETPLWRAGPAGPKTLCNACGVRWKKTGSVIPRLSRSRRTLTKPNSRRKDKSSTMTNTSTSTTATTTATTATTTTTKTAPKSKQKVPDLPALQLPQNPAPYEHVRAPRPRTAAESRRTYESIFSGLMVVPRASRARTRTARAQMFFESVAAAGGGGGGGAGAAGGSPTASAGNQTPTTPAKGSSTGHRRKRDRVYVTEVVAPSPSPSPPPIPRMLPVPEGLGFRIVLAKPSSKYSAFDPSSPTIANNVNDDDDVRQILDSPRTPKLDANSNDVPASSATVPSPQPRIRDATPPRTHQLPISDESVKHEEKRAKTSPKNADVPHAAAVATEDNNASMPPAAASLSASAATKLKDAQEDPKNAQSA